MTFEEKFAELIGLGFTESIVLIGFLLIVIDIFFPTDIPTHIAYVLFAYLVYWNIEAHFIYRVLWGVISWFIFVVFHYQIWISIIQKIVNRFISPDKYIMNNNKIIGSTGVFRIIGETKMVSINGELLPCKTDDNLNDLESVVVLECNDGLYQVKRKNKE